MGRAVKTYRILVHDLTAHEPVVLNAELAGDSRAREFARERLASCADYAAVEVWRGAVRLCRLGADHLRAAA